MEMSEEGEEQEEEFNILSEEKGPGRFQKSKFSKFDMLQVRRLWALWKRLSRSESGYGTIRG